MSRSGTDFLRRVLATAISLACGECPAPVRDSDAHAYAEKRFGGLVDEARERRVPVTLLWPDRPEPSATSPLIVLSHGGAGHRGSYAYLATHLARHGYIVAIPEHVGSSTRALFRGMWEQRAGPGIPEVRWYTKRKE